MNRRHFRIISVALVALVCLLVVVVPNRLLASRAPADFPAPISAREAQARVAAAQAAEQTRRAAALLNVRGAPASTSNLPMVQTVYVAQTGQHISERAGFLSFWRKNGGVLLFGYPVTNELIEDGRIVQYFERARFEYHPELAGTDGQVQLSLLGRELTGGRDFAPGAPEAGEVYFPETGHTLSGVFRRYWEKRGGLPLFGYPISEPLEEASPADGQTYLVQYFERARFEYHPEALAPFYRQQVQAYGLNLSALHEVWLGDLGREAAQARGYGNAESFRIAGAPEWAPYLWQRRIDVDLTAQQLTAYEGDTPVYHAPVATGRDGFNTPTGSYAIYSKLPMQTMTGSAGGESWYVPDIPWVQYVVGGVALHGTYWHDLWGTGVRMSHGCINLNIDDAQWLYEWADVGTPVEIHY